MGTAGLAVGGTVAGAWVGEGRGVEVGGGVGVGVGLGDGDGVGDGLGRGVRVGFGVGVGVGGADGPVAADGTAEAPTGAALAPRALLAPGDPPAPGEAAADAPAEAPAEAPTVPAGPAGAPEPPRSGSETSANPTSTTMNTSSMIDVPRAGSSKRAPPDGARGLRPVTRGTPAGPSRGGDRPLHSVSSPPSSCHCPRSLHAAAHGALVTDVTLLATRPVPRGVARNHRYGMLASG